MFGNFKARLDATEDISLEQPGESRARRLPIKKIVLFTVPLVLLVFAGVCFSATRGSDDVVELDPKSVLRTDIPDSNPKSVVSESQAVESQTSKSIAQTVLSVGQRRPAVVVAVAAVIILAIVGVVVTAVLLSATEETIPIVDPTPAKLEKDNEDSRGGEFGSDAVDQAEEPSAGLIIGLSVGLILLVAGVVGLIIYVKWGKANNCIKNKAKEDELEATSEKSESSIDFTKLTLEDGYDVGDLLPLDVEGRKTLVDKILDRITGTNTEYFGKSDAYAKLHLEFLRPVVCEDQLDLLFEALNRPPHAYYLASEDAEKLNRLEGYLQALADDLDIQLENKSILPNRSVWGTNLSIIVKKYNENSKSLKSKLGDYALEFIEFLVEILLEVDHESQTILFSFFDAEYINEELKPLLLDPGKFSDDELRSIWYFFQWRIATIHMKT